MSITDNRRCTVCGTTTPEYVSIQYDQVPKSMAAKVACLKCAQALIKELVEKVGLIKTRIFEVENAR